MDVRPKILLTETMEKPGVARKTWIEAAQLRMEIARILQAQAEYSLAALNCETAARDYGRAFEMEPDEIKKEFLLQKQISALVEAAIRWQENNSPEMVLSRMEQAALLKDQYECEHPISHLRLDADGKLGGT